MFNMNIWRRSFLHALLGTALTTVFCCAHSAAQTSTLAIEAGHAHSLALKSDTRVWSWGYNNHGQLGDGTTNASGNPVLVQSLTNVTAIARGWEHSMAIQAGGKLWVWGRNDQGQLGIGSTNSTLSPTIVATLTNVTAAAGGLLHSLALTDDGRVWGWGHNSHGQLGNGTTNNSTQPVLIAGLTNVIKITSGDYHAMAIQADGSLWCWGKNNYGQLGLGHTNLTLTPAKITGISNAVHVAGGAASSAALLGGGNVWVWGYNIDGTLGLGNTNSVTQPQQIQSLSNIVGIAGGFYHFLALHQSGMAFSWGFNLAGQVGDGTNIDRSSPVMVTNELNYVAALQLEVTNRLSSINLVAAGGYHSLVLRKGGELWAWGDNSVGQLANGTGGTNANWIPRLSTRSAPQPRSNRFARGRGGNPSNHSFVIPIDQQKGVELSTAGDMGYLYDGISPWFDHVQRPWRYHFDETSSVSNQVAFPMLNGIAAFGAEGGGSQLYVKHSYSFGVFGGMLNETAQTSNEIRILVFDRSHFSSNNVVPIATNSITIPRQTAAGSSTVWTQFATNGFRLVLETNGLRTVLEFVEGGVGEKPWGIQFFYDGTNAIAPTNSTLTGYKLTHLATTNRYFYQVELLGYVQVDPTNALPLGAYENSATWAPLYSLDFAERPSWRAVFVDQPHFTGEPAPPGYDGKTVAELRGLIASVTNQVALTNAAYLLLNGSPELRVHSALDEFVADMGSDPIRLANFVQNEIELTDALSYGEAGQASGPAVFPGGVNRGALGVFLERQGSPTEQCALLVYLLRRAGYPAAYVFPTNDNVKLLDERLSRMLRMQVKGMVHRDGTLITTNSLITVNYPWVVATVGGQSVSIFPWLKDTEIVEGLNYRDYLPSSYNDLNNWIRGYLQGATNLVGTGESDDSAGTTFFNTLGQSLRDNHHGLSVDDLGVRIRNRQKQHATWGEFPVPNTVSNAASAAVVADLDSLTNVPPYYGKIFDTMQIEVASVVNPGTKISTLEMRMVDLHNRKLLTGTNSAGLFLWLAPFGTNTNTVYTFSSYSTNSLNTLSNALSLIGSDTTFTVQLNQKRYRFITNAIAPLGVMGQNVITTTTRFGRGNLTAICLDFGRVTRQMLRPHAEDYWRVGRLVKADTNYVPSVMDYQGTAAYLMGMTYYERVGRAHLQLGQLFKVHIVSSQSAGLSLYHFQTNQMVPKLDMVYSIVAIAGNETLHPDSGDDRFSASKDFFRLVTLDSSSEEHLTINNFMQDKDAISTVKLLRLAHQRSGPSAAGFIELTSRNYTDMGESVPTGYGPAKLKEHDPSFWAEVTNFFSGEMGNYTHAYITPGPITNKTASYKGMGAFVYSSSEVAALIGGNMNGGFGGFVTMFNIVFGDIFDRTLNYGLINDAVRGFSITTLNIGPSDSYNLPKTLPFWLTPNIANGIASGNVGFGGPNTVQQQQFNLLSTSIGLPANLVFGEGINGGGNYVPTIGTEHAQVLAWLADPVNVVSGEFYIDEVDITLPGPMPLSLRRTYSSHNLDLIETSLGYGWKQNHLPYLRLTDTNVIYAAEQDGTVIAYRQAGSGTPLWRPRVEDNRFLNNSSGLGAGGQGNALNNWITNRIESGQTNYYLMGADGSQRRYLLKSYPLDQSGNFERVRPYLESWADLAGNAYTYSYGTNAATPSYGRVRRIQSSNGSFLMLEHDVEGHICEIIAGDGRRLNYEYDGHGDLIRVTLPDRSTVRYEYQHVTTVTNSITNTTSTHLLVRETKPDGRVLVNEYDSDRRVTNQLATVGLDLNPVRNATFTFSTNYPLTNLTFLPTGTTVVMDYKSNNITYVYTNGLIHRIQDQLSASLIQEWYAADETNSPAHPRSLKSVTDKRGLFTSYFYDQRGNVTNSTIKGDLLGDGDTNTTAVTVAIYNTNNLVELLILPSFMTNKYFYTNTWLLERHEIWPSNAIAGQAITNAFVYCSVTNGSNGTASHGLRQREVRAANSPDAATNEWVYDARGFVLQTTRHPGYGLPPVVVTNQHNERGELAEVTDAAGRRIRFGYDPHGNLQAREVFETGQVLPLAWEYSYYNENGELTWSDGPRFEPEDYVWRDYDGAGRKTTEIRWRSRARFNGLGVEAETGDSLFSTTFYEYDPLGNATRLIDARGNFVTNQYDAGGQLTNQVFFDGNVVPPSAMATNRLTYEPGGLVAVSVNALGGATTNRYTSTGKLSRRVNPDGSTNGWRYFADGRLHREYLRNGNYWESVYDDAARRVTRTFKLADGTDYEPLTQETTEIDRRNNPIRQVNAEGHSFTNIYDGLDRLKVWIGPASITGTAQQARTNYYDASGVVVTNENALRERVITLFDALGRAVTNDVLATGGALVHRSINQYGADHQSVTNTLGTGTNAISTVTFTDTFGKAILSQRFPTSGVMEYSRNAYDSSGNLVSSWDELGQLTQFGYDGLNRLVSNSLPDSTSVLLKYDAAGNLTNRTMAGTLVWAANYDAAGRMLSESLNSTGRVHQYSYYGTSDSAVGLLKRVIDPRSVTNDVAYDDLLRVQGKTAAGTKPEHYQRKGFTYDRLGRVVSLTQTNLWADVQAYYERTLAVLRGFDGYGQLTEEWILDSIGQNSQMIGQEWDASGRRAYLRGPTESFLLENTSSLPPFDIAYQYRADGLMTNITADGVLGTNIFKYAYADNGLLISRMGAGRTNTVSQRDGRGRPMQMLTTVGTNAVLAETMTWRKNSTLAQYGVDRTGTGTWDETRAYHYNPRGQLTNETFSVAQGQVSNAVGFDAGGLGIRTSAVQSGALTNRWEVPTNQVSELGRVLREATQLGGLKLRSHGLAYSEYESGGGTVIGPPAGSVSGKLDVTNNVTLAYDTNSGRWFTDLSLTPGTHQFAMTAQHTNSYGPLAVTVTNTFTVNSQGGVTNLYDAAGNVTNRTLSGGRVQSLSWDADGRLVHITERDGGNNGFEWSALYDGLGRRLYTVDFPVEAGLTNMFGTYFIFGKTKTHSSYDPLVEFQEIYVGQNLFVIGAQFRFKIYGPDLSGMPGGMQGVGGLDAIIQPWETGPYQNEPGQVWGAVNDQFGDMVGWVKDGQMTWNMVPVAGYGAVQGYAAPTLSLSQSMEEATHWRGRRMDPTGLYWLGARYYDGLSGRFMSPDPLGHEASLSLYDYANGDPINYLDPDGRLSARLTEVGKRNALVPWEFGDLPVMQRNTYTDYFFKDGSHTGPLPPWEGIMTGPDSIVGRKYSIVTEPTGQFISYTLDRRNGRIDDDYGQWTSTPITKIDIEQQQRILAIKSIIWGLAVADGAGALIEGAGIRILTTGGVNANRLAGERAVNDFIAHVEANGMQVIGREVQFNTPFGVRRMDVILRNPGTGLVGGVEVKSSLGAFNRFDAPARQQFSADRWINQFGGQGIGKHSDIFIDNTIKIHWPAPPP